MGNHPAEIRQSRVDLELRKQRNKEDMRSQFVSFALMIFLTALAFIAVGTETFSKWFVLPFILLLAIIQVIFQLYYFMHMSHKGHGLVSLFLYSGVIVGFVTLWAFVTIIWL
jgi:cytochrome c oxidase subunit 4